MSSRPSWRPRASFPVSLASLVMSSRLRQWRIVPRGRRRGRPLPPRPPMSKPRMIRPTMSRARSLLRVPRPGPKVAKVARVRSVVVVVAVVAAAAARASRAQRLALVAVVVVGGAAVGARRGRLLRSDLRTIAVRVRMSRVRRVVVRRGMRGRRRWCVSPSPRRLLLCLLPRRGRRPSRGRCMGRCVGSSRRRNSTSVRSPSSVERAPGRVARRGLWNRRRCS